MDVSNCPECKKALKAALLKGTDPSKLKMKDGHLPGCPSLSPQKGEADAVRRPQTDPQAGWPWAEGNFRIAPSPRPPADPAGPAQGWQDGGGRTGDRPTSHDPTGGASRGTRAPRPLQPPARGGDRRDEPRGRHPVPRDDHASGYAAVAAEHAAKKPHVQQFKVVDHANQGEHRDHVKGAWFVALILLALLTVPLFPPLILLYAGAMIMLFLLR